MAREAAGGNDQRRPALLRIDYDAGHGFGSTKKQRYEELADVRVPVLATRRQGFPALATHSIHAFPLDGGGNLSHRRSVTLRSVQLDPRLHSSAQERPTVSKATRT
jgi:hypothetical protein